MVYVIGLVVTVVLLSLSILHFYWSVGGQWGLAAAIPILDGQPLFETEFWDTLPIALALLTAAVICLGAVNLDNRLPFLPDWVYRLGTWCIVLVFLLRAIGEFHYAGLFKQGDNSLFTYWDTVLYTPLCFGVAICCTILAINVHGSRTLSD